MTEADVIISLHTKARVSVKRIMEILGRGRKHVNSVLSEAGVEIKSYKRKRRQWGVK